MSAKKKPVLSAKKSPAAKPKPEPNPEAAAAITPQQEALRRANECGEAIDALLKQYRCCVVPFVERFETVGDDRSRVLLTSAFNLVPLP